MARKPTKRRGAWVKVHREWRYGHHFASHAELVYADELELRLKAGKIAGWNYEPQVFRLDVNGFHVCKYTPDFIINHNDGSDEIVEVKGWWRPDAKLRVKLFQALYPRYKFTVVGTPMDKRKKREE